MNRRKFIAAAGFAGIGLASGIRPGVAGDDPAAGLYPAGTNPAYADAGRKITPEAINTTYNNFYEFGTSKRISKAAEALVIRPWEIAFEGEIEAPFKIQFDDLIKKMQLEERVYRHRCVEAWSMAVPWSGFTLRQLVELARPTAKAKYVKFETFNDPEIAPGQKPSLFGGSYPWPYTEAVTMAEADNDLAFMVTGAYGKPVAKSMGAPMRLHLPVEVRLQVGQIDQQDQLYLRTPQELLGSAWAQRIRFLGQCEPRGFTSTLEPGIRARSGDRPDDADHALQWLCRRGRVALRRYER